MQSKTQAKIELMELDNAFLAYLFAEPFGPMPLLAKLSPAEHAHVLETLEKVFDRAEKLI